MSDDKYRIPTPSPPEPTAPMPHRKELWRASLAIWVASICTVFTGLSAWEQHRLRFDAKQASDAQAKDVERSRKAAEQSAGAAQRLADVTAKSVDIANSTMQVNKQMLQQSVTGFRMQQRAWLYVKNVQWEKYFFRVTLFNRGKTPTNHVVPKCLITEDIPNTPKKVMDSGPMRQGPIAAEDTGDILLGLPPEPRDNPFHLTTVRCRVVYSDIFNADHVLNYCYVLIHGGDTRIGMCLVGNSTE